MKFFYTEQLNLINFHQKKKKKKGIFSTDLAVLTLKGPVDPSCLLFDVSPSVLYHCYQFFLYKRNRFR